MLLESALYSRMQRTLHLHNYTTLYRSRPNGWSFDNVCFETVDKQWKQGTYTGINYANMHWTHCNRYNIIFAEIF